MTFWEREHLVRPVRLPTPRQLSEAEQANILDLLREGHEFEAIRRYRVATNCRLRQAVIEVRRMQQELGG